MAAVLHRDQIEVREIVDSSNHSRARVPQNVKARLMFYLKCVSDILDFEAEQRNLNRLTDYMNYELLTDEETDQLTFFCSLVSPEALVGKCLFENEEMCGSSPIKFYELESLQRQIVVTEDLMIGGQRKHVRKIMFYKKPWMKENYDQPMHYLNNRILQRIQAVEDQDRLAYQSGCCVVM